VLPSILGAALISLGSLFSREPAPLLGIDVSSSSVKLVELGRNRSGDLVLERCAMEPLERGWITDGNIEKFDEVAEAVRRVVRKSGSKTKNVALALPASAVITKKIILPGGLSDKELEAQVESEANQYIPFSLDEVSLDFCVIGPSANSVGDVEWRCSSPRLARKKCLTAKVWPRLLGSSPWSWTLSRTRRAWPLAA
jgi:type IV pilus assembly protein PilM